VAAVKLVKNSISERRERRHSGLAPNWGRFPM